MTEERDYIRRAASEIGALRESYVLLEHVIAKAKDRGYDTIYDAVMAAPIKTVKSKRWWHYAFGPAMKDD